MSFIAQEVLRRPQDAGFKMKGRVYHCQELLLVSTRSHGTQPVSGGKGSSREEERARVTTWKIPTCLTMSPWRWGIFSCFGETEEA